MLKLMITIILKVNIFEFQMPGIAPSTLHVLIDLIFTVVSTIIVPTVQMTTLRTVTLEDAGPCNQVRSHKVSGRGTCGLWPSEIWVSGPDV